MISKVANLLSLLIPKAATIPIKIGITAPALAVADGTKKASKIDTKIVPKTIGFVLLPTIFKTYSAKRLCKLVICIALAKKSAAATRAKAERENPEKASDSALLVPNCSVPPGTSKASPISFPGTGDNPSRIISKPTIITADTGYLTASVTHIMTANAKTDKALSPITPSDSGAGKKLIIIITKNASISQTGL